MKGEIVEEIRLNVVKRKRSQRPWQSCDPNSVTSSSFTSSPNMTALPISRPQRGSMGTVVCQTDPPCPPPHPQPPSTSITRPLACKPLHLQCMRPKAGQHLTCDPQPLHSQSVINVPESVMRHLSTANVTHRDKPNLIYKCDYLALLAHWKFYFFL